MLNAVRKAQRKRVRAMRRALSDEQRCEAAARLCQRIQSLAAFAAAQRIAGFLAFDGEMDIAPVLEQALKSGKSVYLPILQGKKTAMAFAPYHPDKPLRRNDFGILEPDVNPSQYLPARALDLVLTPLVAFDARGNRLGVGGGFYDRTFAFLNHDTDQAKTCLLGVAYDFQHLATIDREPWDVPLHGVVTDKRFYPGANGEYVK